MALLAFLFVAGWSSCSSGNKSLDKKFLIVGMDGLDPVIAKRLMERGDLPNFKKLSLMGSFMSLQTSNPPQSPVAWSNFISGHNPGHHDVFDFITRDPKTYLPEIGMTEVKKRENKTFSDLMAGLTGPQVKTRRKGKSFWDYLSEANILNVILHCPVTFPAESLNGRLLSGMGTPDIKGTQGIFSFFTTKGFDQKEVQGRVKRVEWKGNKIETLLTGPKMKKGEKMVEIEVPVEIRKGEGQKIWIKIQNSEQEVAVGEWSDWFRVKFKLGFLQTITGICRFHLNSLEPDLGLYVSPVNIDPKKPAMKISYPEDYAKEIYEKIGFYYTQGMPYDTWALNEGRMDEKTFLELAYEIQRENVEHFKWELEKFEGGFLFVYFGITDLIQHMFWRYIDPEHPNRGQSSDPEISNAIDDVYKHMDGVLGDILEKLDSETVLMVISDHGFGSFRRAVHVNSWLRDQGYLVLNEGDTEGKELFQNVDWSETRAYSVGFGGIYINQFGREKMGVVYKGTESNKLKEEIIGKLKAWKDTGGSAMIRHIYLGEKLYTGEYAHKGPDLYIGFEKGYRASWQTALGAAPKSLVEDNMKYWGGDHLCDPELVPGVLFSNRKITATNPSLLDVSPTVLNYFGVKSNSSLEGRSLF